MRALFIILTDHPGGSERVTFGLAAELARRPGWSVEVIIVSSQLPVSFSAQVLPDNVRVHYGPLRSWHAAFALLPLRLLFRRFDLIFTTQIYVSALVSLMRRLQLVRSGAHVVRESASLLDYFAGASPFRKSLIRRLYGCYGGEALIIAQTRYMADHLRSRLPPRSAQRLRVIPNPVDIEAVREGASAGLGEALRAQLSGGPNIVVCGRLIEVKQPSLALEAFDLLVHGGCPARLVFVGGGDLEGRLRRDAQRRGLGDRVLFLGRLNNPYPALAACQYGLITSSNEGFPNVILEMMACGYRQIVTTPCAGDLDRLPGVTVTKGFGAREIAEALEQAIASNEDRGPVYKAAAAKRSMQSCLDDLLAGAYAKSGVLSAVE